jgi:hypothetical protein
VDRKVDILVGTVAEQAVVVVSAALGARLAWEAGVEQAAQPEQAESPGAGERRLATPVPRMPARM